jgi:hypothetical protein
MSDQPAPAPALLALRDQLDARWPLRSRASDGILGDAAHQARASDHNQGNALDVTHDPVNGPDLEALADMLLRDERTHYVIWNRRIRNRAFEDGAWRPYSGASPHTEHLHVSIDPTRRDDASGWQLPGGEAATDEIEHEAVERSRTATVGALVGGLGVLAAVALLLRHVERRPLATRTGRRA